MPDGNPIFKIAERSQPFSRSVPNAYGIRNGRGATHRGGVLPAAGAGHAPAGRGDHRRGDSPLLSTAGFALGLSGRSGGKIRQAALGAFRLWELCTCHTGHKLLILFSTRPGLDGLRQVPAEAHGLGQSYPPKPQLAPPAFRERLSRQLGLRQGLESLRHRGPSRRHHPVSRQW